MVREARRAGESQIYHLVARGVSHCIIFENDDDRRHFLEVLADLTEEFGLSIHAWCLMDNHYHVLAQAELATVSQAMRRLNSSYALYFNAKHERNGHLFQGRFKSEPVDTDEYFLTVLRYIHQNPVKAGITADCDYVWSSYRVYVGEDDAVMPELTDTALALTMLGGAGRFAAFHARIDETAVCCDIHEARKGIADEEAIRCAQAVLGEDNLHQIASLPREQRNAALRKLKAAHLSIRQIERLTGISKSLVAKS